MLFSSWYRWSYRYNHEPRPCTSCTSPLAIASDGKWQSCSNRPDKHCSIVRRWPGGRETSVRDRLAIHSSPLGDTSRRHRKNREGSDKRQWLADAYRPMCKRHRVKELRDTGRKRAIEPGVRSVCVVTYTSIESPLISEDRGAGRGAAVQESEIV